MNESRREKKTLAEARSYQDELHERTEEIEVYKERLQEIEIAFRYNLNLLSDRDMELDMLEEQLRSGIIELEKVSLEKSESEDILKRVVEAKTKEINFLRNKLVTCEKTIQELERKNRGTINTLKKTVEEIKREQQEESAKTLAKLKKEKLILEKNFVRALRAKEDEHLESMDRMKQEYLKQLDEMTKEKGRYNAYRMENKKLKKQVLLMEKINEEKEMEYMQKIKQLKSFYTELDKVIDCKRQVDEKGVMTKLEVRHVSTQSIDQDDRNELRMLREQNTIFRSIIKKLKRKRTIVDDESGNTSCGECAKVKDKVEETNKRFEGELNELRKALEWERTQRTEEEAILQNLEMSVVCLKEKLLNNLHRNAEEMSGGDLCSYTYNKEIANEIQISLIEDRLSKKVNSVIMAVEREKKEVNKRLEEVRRDCLEKVHHSDEGEKQKEQQVLNEGGVEVWKHGYRRDKQDQSGLDLEVPGLRIKKMQLRSKKNFHR